MSAKSEHRAGVFDNCRDDLGMVRCHVRRIGLKGAGPCEGRLQAAHYFSVQSLRNLRSNMLVAGHRYNDDDPRFRLLTLTLDELISDDRNGLPLCVGHHEIFDGKRPPQRLYIPPPPGVRQFAADYGLDLPTAPACETCEGSGELDPNALGSNPETRVPNLPCPDCDGYGNRITEGAA